MRKKMKLKDTNTISNNLLKFPKKVTNNDTKKYELFNVVSGTGDSIYSPSFEEFPRGQVFYSESLIREIIRQELAAAIGVLKTV